MVDAGPMFYQRSPDYESNMRMAQTLMAAGSMAGEQLNEIQGRPVQ